jgi:predicted HTH domain antitoxin
VVRFPAFRLIFGGTNEVVIYVRAGEPGTINVDFVSCVSLPFCVCFSVTMRKGSSMTTITLELPDDLLALSGFRADNLSHDALKMIVLELYREDIVSLGKAAQLSGLTIDGFMEFASSRKVPLHYGDAELSEDRVSLQQNLP